VDQWEEPAPAELPRPAPASAARANDDLRPVATASAAREIEPLARMLGDAGITFAVRGAVNRFTLLVSADEVERALATLGVGEVAPDGSPVCPACGTDARGAAECPDCGLSLAGDAEARSGPHPSGESSE
jgi:hypothetical protein